MNGFTNRPLVPCGVLAVVVVLGIVVVLWGAQQYTQRRRLAAAHAIATTFGFRSEDTVATGFPCSEIIPECWVYLYFKTDLTHDAVQDRIATLPYTLTPLPTGNLKDRLPRTNRTFAVTGRNPQYAPGATPPTFTEWSSFPWTAPIHSSGLGTTIFRVTRKRTRSMVVHLITH